ncbi:MAG TPA: hypothetical protein VJU18_06245 [Vicinamibacteria bacterium]|nr:hypothetical protein [Vicinamibacteria bacterium]
MRKSALVVASFAALSLTPSPVRAEGQVRLGAGLGIPYGVIGLNVEARAGDHVGVTAGIGHTVFAGVGWCVGGRGYLFSADRKLRPRLGAYFGTAFVQADLEKKKAGLALGPGAHLRLGKSGKHGLEADLLVIVTPSTSSVEDEWGGESVGVPVKLSLGYTFSF